MPIEWFNLDSLADGHDPLVKGWRFSATLSETTPLAILEMHGLVSNSRTRPEFGAPPNQGIWVYITATFRELGIDLDEVPNGTMASQFGQVPVDGGELLPFLKRYRALIESDLSDEDCFKRVTQLAAERPQWPLRVLDCKQLSIFAKIRAERT